MAKALRRTSASRTGCIYPRFSEEAAVELAMMLGYPKVVQSPALVRRVENESEALVDSPKPEADSNPEVERRMTELELERLVRELGRRVEKESEAVVDSPEPEADPNPEVDRLVNELERLVEKRETPTMPAGALPKSQGPSRS